MIRKTRPRKVLVKVSLADVKDGNTEPTMPAPDPVTSLNREHTGRKSQALAREMRATASAAAPEGVQALLEPRQDEGSIPLGVQERLSAGANIIQAWREHLGLKPKDVACRMGVVPGVFEQYERWGSNAPAKTRSRIATAFGIAPELLEG